MCVRFSGGWGRTCLSAGGQWLFTGRLMSQPDWNSILRAVKSCRCFAWWMALDMSMFSIRMP